MVMDNILVDARDHAVLRIRGRDAYIACLSCDRTVPRHEEPHRDSYVLLLDGRRLCFVIRLHLFEAVNCVGGLVVVDNFVVNAAHQQQVVVSVAFFIRLLRIVAWSSGVRRFDVADIPDEGLIEGARILAPWKRTSIARLRVQ